MVDASTTSVTSGGCGAHKGDNTAQHHLGADAAQGILLRAGGHAQQGLDFSVEPGHQEQGGQQAEQDAGEQQVV